MCLHYIHLQKGSRHKNPENRKQMTWRQNLSHLLRRSRSGSSTNNNVRENHQPRQTPPPPHSTSTINPTANTTQPQLNTTTSTTTTITPLVNDPVVTGTQTTAPITQGPGKQSNGTSRQRQLMSNCVPHHQTPADIKRDDCFLDVDTKWSQQRQTSPKSSKNNIKHDA